MRTTEIGSPPQKRRLWTWLQRACVGSLLIGLYVAGIGPLTELESRDYGQRKYWGYLHVIYMPVFWSWKHGPDWWANGLEGSTEFFRTPQVCGPNLSKRFVASYYRIKAYRFMKWQFKKEGWRQPELGKLLLQFERDMKH